MTWAIEQKSYSQRRACVLIGLAPKTYRYRSRRPDDAGLRQRLRELALERRRFGYRRLLILLRREGLTLNHNDCSGSTARSGSRSGSGAAASARSARGHR